MSSHAASVYYTRQVSQLGTLLTPLFLFVTTTSGFISFVSRKLFLATEKAPIGLFFQSHCQLEDNDHNL